MQRRSTARALAALALLVALTGCAAVTAPEPGLSPAETESIQELIRDNAWLSTGLPDELRPPDPLMVAVAPEDWSSTFVACMNAAGFDNYEVSGGGGYSVSSSGDTLSDAEMLAQYVCQVSLWRDNGASWYNEAQIDYLYTYFEQSLVPCIATRGARLDQIPTRAEFTDQLGWWNPYYSVTEPDQKWLFGDKSIARDCPPMPAGMANPEYLSLWN